MSVPLFVHGFREHHNQKHLKRIGHRLFLFNITYWHGHERRLPILHDRLQRQRGEKRAHFPRDARGGGGKGFPFAKPA